MARTQARHTQQQQSVPSTVLLLLAGLFSCTSLTGCLLIGGSSRGGFFIFPGSLGLIVLIVIIALVLRRR